MTVKEQYKRERKRIQNYISKAQTKGYRFDYELPPSVSKLDKVTKKMVNELKKITPKTLRKTGYYGGELTYGETIPAEEAFKLAKQEAQKKRKETIKRKQTIKLEEQDMYVIEEVIRMVERLPDVRWFGFNRPRNYESIKQVLINMLNDTADEYDSQGKLLDYLTHLKQNLPDISVATEVISYDSDEENVDTSYNLLLAIFKHAPLTIQEAKDLENFNESTESMKDYEV